MYELTHTALLYKQKYSLAPLLNVSIVVIFLLLQLSDFFTSNIRSEENTV
jgi:hypothetical protein